MWLRRRGSLSTTIEHTWDFVGSTSPSITGVAGTVATYLALIEHCREELAGQGYKWSAREVDLALYQPGDQKKRLGKKTLQAAIIQVSSGRADQP